MNRLPTVFLHAARLPRVHRLTPIAALAACLGLCGTALAADAPDAAASAPEAAAPADDAVALKGVTVRARNRIEKIQDVPLSVSVISGKELDRELAYDIGAITKRAANVIRNSGNSRTFSMSVRNVGKVSQTEAQDTSVGVIQDGVNLAYAPLTSFDFFDVDTVEVARGPQGTLLGKNSTMGVIVINTRKPSFVPEAYGAVTLGQRNTVISQFAVGGPVIDDLLAWRGSLVVNKGGGAFANRYNPDQTYFDRDRVSGRLQLLLRPSADLSARLSVDIQPKAGEYYNGQTVRTEIPATYSNGAPTSANNNLNIRAKLARPYFADRKLFDYDKDYLNNPNVNLDNQRPLITELRGTSAEIKWKLGGGHELTSITAYRDYHFHARNDEGTPFDISLNGGGKVDAYRQRSQELRVSSAPGGFVDYQFGALYFNNSVDFGQLGWSSGWGSDAGAWFATQSQYDKLDTPGAGRELLRVSLDGLNRGAAQWVRNNSLGLYGQADWHLSRELTLTTGVRLTRENRKNSANSTIVDNGFAGVGLNPVSVDYGTGTPFAGKVATGGFDSIAFSQATVTAGTAGKLTDAALADATQVALADSVAKRYFGVATYAALTPEQRAQIAAAKAIRATQIGTLWPEVAAPEFHKTQPGFNLSPRYKINEDQTAYAALQYGEKGGVAQVVNGVPRLADPEKVTSFEVGLKSALLGKTLFLNTDVFLSKVKGYQQAVSLPDPLNPAATVSYTGNAERVQIHGLEVDGAYNGIRNLSVRFSGAYTVAKYKEFKFSPQPVENQYPGAPVYQDVSGQFLTGAPRYTFNIGPEYRRPIAGDHVLHTSFNAAFSSGYNSDSNLSAYGYVKKRWLADASFGVGRADGKYDVSLVVKNLFNDDTPQAVSWNSFTQTDPRWVGVQFSGRL
ncbi:MAG TPA: TonB-dependent receptor [Roseateles sp.]